MSEVYGNITVEVVSFCKVPYLGINAAGKKGLLSWNIELPLLTISAISMISYAFWSGNFMDG